MNIACVEAIPSNTAMHLTRPLQLTEAHRVPRTSSSLRAGDGQRWMELQGVFKLKACQKLASRAKRPYKLQVPFLTAERRAIKALADYYGLLLFVDAQFFFLRFDKNLQIAHD